MGSVFPWLHRSSVKHRNKSGPWYRVIKLKLSHMYYFFHISPASNNLRCLYDTNMSCYRIGLMSQYNLETSQLRSGSTIAKDHVGTLYDSPFYNAGFMAYNKELLEEMLYDIFLKLCFIYIWFSVAWWHCLSFTDNISFFFLLSSK